MTPLQQKIEALLFFKNEPISFNWLSKKLNTSLSDIEQSIFDMKEFYENRGFILVTTEDDVALMTANIAQDIIQTLTQEQQGKELSKQALETLAIIIYKGKVTKPEIDYIRGVNSVFILRNLLIRGLITKKNNESDKRSPYYIPTHDLLSFLGIDDIRKLSDFDEFQKELQLLEENYLKEQENDVLGESISETHQ